MQSESTQLETTTALPRKALMLPILLMTWPLVLLLLCILGYALFNVFAPPQASDTVLLGGQSPIVAALNVLLFFALGIAIFLGPVSFIIGLIVIIQRGAKK